LQPEPRSHQMGCILSVRFAVLVMIVLSILEVVIGVYRSRESALFPSR